MPLDPSYLDYPRRAYGMDQPLYSWAPAPTAPRLAWRGGAGVLVSVIVPLEFHRLDPAGSPFRHTGAMVTPYPDLRHYTTRDYGLRVGVFRILEALAATGVKATFPVNAVLLERAGPLIDTIVAEGHEIAAYGLEADAIHWSGLAQGVEEGWIAKVRTAFDAAGLAPRIWMSPARQQSFLTLERIAKAGFDVCLDWEQDTAPTPMTTSAGVVLAVPVSNELDDRTLLLDRRQSEDVWRGQIVEAADYLAVESMQLGGRSLAFTLTPYVSGQPFRAAAMKDLLSQLKALGGVATVTAGEVADQALNAAASV